MQSFSQSFPLNCLFVSIPAPSSTHKGQLNQYMNTMRESNFHLQSSSQFLNNFLSNFNRPSLPCHPFPLYFPKNAFKTTYGPKETVRIRPCAQGTHNLFDSNSKIAPKLPSWNCHVMLWKFMEVTNFPLNFH